MNIIDWFPKNRRREFWIMDLTSLYRFIIAYVRSGHGGWAGYFAWQHIGWEDRYPALKDLVASYAISVFHRRLREGKRKHGHVLKVMYSSLAGPKYMFQSQLDECRIDDSKHYKIQESLPIWYCSDLYMDLLPHVICPPLQRPQDNIIVRPVPSFGYISREWINENYVPYVAMLIEIPWEEKRKILWKMWRKRKHSKMKSRRPSLKELADERPM